jgi:transposase
MERPYATLAVARAALRESDLPVAHPNGHDRDVRLLVDHREDLLAERTRAVNRLRSLLHELNTDWDPPARSLDRASALDRVRHRLAGLSGTVARGLQGRWTDVEVQPSGSFAEIQQPSTARVARSLGA